MKKASRKKNNIYSVRVFGTRVFSAEIPDEIVEDLKKINWKVKKDSKGKVSVISPRDVHNWIRGEIIIRENSVIYLSDLYFKKDVGMVKLFFKSGIANRNNIINLEAYRIYKNAAELVRAGEEISDLLEEKATLIREEEEILRQMKIYEVEQEEIKKMESKIRKHKKELSKDYKRLSETIPKIREKVNLIALKNLLLILNKLEREKPSEYREIKSVLKKAAADYFSLREGKN